MQEEIRAFPIWGSAFRHTNEDPAAINAGLNLNSDDCVLAICGSGDQAFAMVEIADVTAIDHREDQTDYVRTRADMLANGEFEGFVDLPDDLDIDPRVMAEWRYVANYFQQRRRMDNIRERLGLLEIQHGCIFEILKRSRGKFTKLYLSNALGYLSDDETVQSQLEVVAQYMPNNSLVYIANSCDVQIPNKGFEIDAELSYTAHSMQQEMHSKCKLPGMSTHDWCPSVLRVRN